MNDVIENRPAASRWVRVSEDMSGFGMWALTGALIGACFILTVLTLCAAYE